MDHTKKKSIIKKLEELFRRRPARKELVQRNILQADSVSVDIEEPKQRKALLMRIMSKTGKEQMSEGTGKGSQNVRQSETKRSQTVSAIPTAPNSLQAMTPLSVSSPAVIYDRTSYLQTEDGEFKPSSSPTSPRLAVLSPPIRSMSSSSYRKSMDSPPSDFGSEPGMERSRSASRIKFNRGAVNTQQSAGTTSPTSPKSPTAPCNWTNRAPSNTSVRTYIDGSAAKFSTLPTKMSTSPPSPKPRRSSDEETTILREQCKQSSKLNIHANMIFVKTPVLSSPLSECPTPFFDQLMMLDDSDM